MNPFIKSATEARARGDREVAKRIRIEGAIANKIVSAILRRNACVTINDGEEIALSKSCTKAAIMNAMFSTDEDYVIAHNADGVRLGYFFFVYGNDGTDVISDWVDNDFCNSIIEEIKYLDL